MYHSCNSSFIVKRKVRCVYMRSFSSWNLDSPTKIISLSNERHLSDNPKTLRGHRGLPMSISGGFWHTRVNLAWQRDCISVPACRTWRVFCLNVPVACQETCAFMYLQERDQVRLRRRLQLRLQTTGELLGIDLCVLRSHVQMDFSMYVTQTKEKRRTTEGPGH